MKLKLLLIAISFSFFANASHLAGGSITWECLSNNQYQFTLVLYRDCTGIPLTTTIENINTNAGSSIACTKDTVYYLNKECNAPTCIGASTGYVGAIEAHIYKSDSITLSGAPPPSGWYFKWYSCCRPGAITNLQNAAGQGYLLRAMMYPYFPAGGSTPLSASSCYDSAPRFLESPDFVACSTVPSNISASTSDLDLDSVHYSFAEPMQQGVTGPPFSPVNWASGYSSISPLPSTAQNASNIAASLNPLTGDITFKSYTQGAFTTCVKASSFRDGQLIAEVFRDAPIFIKSCPPPGGLCSPGISTYPKVTAGWTQPQDSIIQQNGLSQSPTALFIRAETAKVGDTVRFRLAAQDLDLSPNCSPETIELWATGTSMSAAPSYNSDTNCPAGFPCATLTSLNSGGGFVSSINNDIAFTWPITCDVKDGQHEFTFQFENDNCPYPTKKTVRVLVKVENPKYLENPVFDTTQSQVLSNGDIELVWNKPDTATLFSHYSLLHQVGSMPPTILDSIGNYNDTSYIHVAPPSGTNRYWIRSVSGCSFALDSINLVGDTVSSITFKTNIGIEEELNRVRVYPQPMKDKVVFEGLARFDNLNIQVFDVSGRLLKEKTLSKSNEKYEMNVADLSQGIYVFVLSWADYSTSIKLIKHE